MIGFSFSSFGENIVGASALLLAPKIELRSGQVLEGEPLGEGYRIGELYIEDRVERLFDGVYEVFRRIENCAEEEISFKDILTVKDTALAERYLIPCILYNGNEHGSSNTPKSLSVDGEDWVFSYDRTSIPSCTLTEWGEGAVALFGLCGDESSLVSSCSLSKKPDGYEHKIIRPVTEAPYTYSSKNIMTERYDTYITLGAGESFASRSCVAIIKPKIRNYAAAELIKIAMKVLDPQKDPSLSPEKVRELGISFSKALLYDYKGKKLIITHYAQRLFRYQHMVKITNAEMAEMMKDPYYTELGAFDERFEMGWADQNLLNARMLGRWAIDTSDAELLDTAVGIFDAFIETQKENGLCYTLYEQNFDSESVNCATPDVCNLGWGAAEAVRMYRMLLGIGREHGALVRFARGICDFFLSAYTDEYAFGKSYYMDGTPAQTKGSIGGFMIVAMLELYSLTKEQKYLDAAIRAHDFYYKRDLDNFVCTAGALDCTSIDKETAYPFVASSLMLYRITEDEKYVKRAEMAAYYFTSWMFFYDVLYKNGSEFEEYGYSTTGGTAISAEHHAIDSWGSVIVADLCEIADITGDDMWRRIARLMWSNATQGITLSEDQLTHGMHRPVGAQNEGFFQARWTKYRPTPELRGHFNDCLSAWCGAYRMWTVERMKEKGQLDIIS